MTIRGYYRRSERFPSPPPAPHIAALVDIPALGRTVAINFLLDTGADVTSLLPQSVRRLGIDLDSVQPLEGTPERLEGVGGYASCKVVEAVVNLPQDADSAVFVRFPVNLVLIEGEPAQASGPHEPLSAVIGRDILNLCECTFNAATGRVTLEPL